MSIIYNHQCEANEYSKCYGYKEEVDVIFKYRNKKGTSVPDEVVKVCLCTTHKRWLSKIHQDKPLEMRGEVPQYALHDDLFYDFSDKLRIYTLFEAESTINNVKEVKFYLVNGSDVEKFRGLIKKEITDKYNAESLSWSTVIEEGFFQTCLHSIKSDDEKCEFTNAVVEVVEINSKTALEAVAKGLVTFYKPMPDGEMRKISDAAQAWFPRVEENPTLETEYTCEPIPEFICAHFLKKQAAEKFKEFKECCYFIEYEVNNSIVDWHKICENSPHDEKSLFETVTVFTEALLSEDKLASSVILCNLRDDAKISDDVLWVTYVLVNHYLYSSQDNKKQLYASTELIDEFIFRGLKKELLALAISGERLRFVSNKRRDSYDILETNEFVVEYLVPKYVNGTDIIYISEYVKLTPLEYWHDYENTTSYIGGGMHNMQDEPFEKNTKIYEYLLTHTPADIIEKINTSLEQHAEVLSEEHVAVLSEEHAEVLSE